MKQLSTVVILNCWKRKVEGKILKRSLERQTLNSEVDNIKLSYDDGRLGIWNNYKQALKIPSKNDERFRMIIQDDVELIPGALEKVSHILSYLPERSCGSFYTPDNNGYREFAKSGHRIMLTHTNVWVQIFAFKTSLIEEFFEWNEKNIKADYEFEDWRITAFCKEKDVPIYVHYPTMGQHLGAYRSTLGHSGKVGKRYRYARDLERDVKVKGIDWKKEVEDPFKNEMYMNFKRIHKDTITNERNDRTEVPWD